MITKNTAPIRSSLYADLRALIPEPRKFVDAFMQGKWLVVILDSGIHVKIKDQTLYKNA